MMFIEVRSLVIWQCMNLHIAFMMVKQIESNVIETTPIIALIRISLLLLYQMRLDCELSFAV